MADPDRDSLRAKIAALRAKTVASGCTEAEALAAAALAAKLMAQHGIDEADLGMTEAESPDPVFTLQPWHLDLSFAIERCTNTAMLFRSVKGVLFVGLEPGPEIAAYLRDLSFRAVEGDLARFQRSLIYASRRGPAAKRHADAQFCEAMAKRLRARLLEVFGPTIDPVAQARAEEALDRRVPAIIRGACRQRAEPARLGGHRGRPARRRTRSAPPRGERGRRSPSGITREARVRTMLALTLWQPWATLVAEGVKPFEFRR